MTLNDVIAPLKKWWWLIVAASLIAALASFLAATQQASIYQSRTTLMVGSSIGNPNPSSGDVWLSQYLASIYADFASREPIQEATRQALGIDWLPNYTAKLVPNTTIIEIVVIAQSPDISQIIANELAHQLILQSPTSGAESQKRQEFVETQLSLIEVDIADTQNSIEDLQQELPTLNSARQIADVQSQIDSLSEKLNKLQSNYASLLSSAPQGAANTLSVLEPAQPGYPVQSNRLVSILLATAVGASLAVGAAYVIEYIDRSLRTEEDVQRVLGVPVLGYIMRLTDESRSPDYISVQPRSPVAEVFRNLRTNLIFAMAASPINTLLISSIDMGDGKTTIATALAISLSQAEKKITIIDADLRRPNIHSHLNLDQSPGLSEAIVASKITKELMPKKFKEGVDVLTAGSTPPNPAELLASNKMDQILENLKKSNDLVILDGPPFLVTDASILASKADGILLIISPGTVREDTARKVKTQIDRVGSHLLGVVFNRILPKDMKKYGEYNYYEKYYTNSKDDSSEEDQPEEDRPDEDQQDDPELNSNEPEVVKDSSAYSGS